MLGFDKVFRWIKRIQILKYSRLAIASTLIMTTVLAGFTVYGDKVGNFVISTPKDTHGSLALTQYEDKSVLTERLAAKGESEITNVTLSDIPDDISSGMGNDFTSKRYLVYSFYLVNNGDTELEVEYHIDIVDVKLNLDSAVRVLLIEDEGASTVYGKPKETENGYGEPEDYPYVATSFLSDTRVMSAKLTGFKAGGAIKYTVVVFLEGNDPECTDSIKGGSIRMDMTFTIIGAKN